MLKMDHKPLTYIFGDTVGFPFVAVSGFHYKYTLCSLKKHLRGRLV